MNEEIDIRSDCQRQRDLVHAQIVKMYDALSEKNPQASNWAKCRFIARKFHYTPEGISKIIERNKTIQKNEKTE